MKTCVIIPCYKVKDKILKVVQPIPDTVDHIFVIDDCCPEQSGQYLLSNINDSRVEVVFHSKNKGVGGAVKTGFHHALKNKCDIAIKIDGDGQMNPELIPKFLNPITSNYADYSKGNRFFKIKYLKQMPTARLIGNTGLSFISKLSTGYWNLMDFTNGYIAIRCDILQYMDLEDVDNRYFFETDMLYQLGIIRAKVLDIPMESVYADEHSSLSVISSLFEFSIKHSKLFCKRIFINYFLRDFNAGSIFLILGLVFLFITLFSGLPIWWHNKALAISTPTGTIIKYLLFSIISLVGCSGWVLYDTFSQPTSSVSALLTTKFKKAVTDYNDF